jgi:hypothetical protein
MSALNADNIDFGSGNENVNEGWETPQPHTGD